MLSGLLFSLPFSLCNLHLCAQPARSAPTREHHAGDRKPLALGCTSRAALSSKASSARHRQTAAPVHPGPAALLHDLLWQLV